MTSVGNSHKNGPIAHWQDSNVLFQIIMVSTNLPIIEFHWLEHTNTSFGTSDSSLKNSWAAHGPGNSNRLEIVFEELFWSKIPFADKIRSE